MLLLIFNSYAMNHTFHILNCIEIVIHLPNILNTDGRYTILCTKYDVI